jgi:class 3 adenylate cyclase
MLESNKRVRLQISISAIFALLIIPALGFVIAFSYYENLKNLSVISDRFIDRARDDAVMMSHDLLDPVAATVRVVAEVAASNPALFRTEQSRNVLYAALNSAVQIDAFYASFEDGYHRVVTRVDEDRRKSDPQIPPNANWHSSYIDAYGGGGVRKRHRTFFERWPDEIKQYSVETSVDMRTTLPHYIAAKRTGALAVTDPIINPDTGYPVISIGYPIGGTNGIPFAGAVSANITVNLLSRLLEHQKASPNSISIIADASGNVIAHPVLAEGIRRVDRKVELATLSELPEPQVVKAVELRALRDTNRFTFEAGPEGREYVALFSPFPVDFAKHWEVLIVTPTDDFVGDLKKTNRYLIWITLALAAFESLMIYFMARHIARPIEIVSANIERIRRLTWDGSMRIRSRVTEIAELERAVALLSSALRSFSVFVPVGLVRELIDSGKPLVPHVESRFMTVLFSDVENFSTIAETMPPQELSDQASRYFEIVTGAVAEEHGTVDKFIGDSVMAFWGAPTAVEDHVYRACLAALKASYRMKRRNREWAHVGLKQMKVRFGVHCADVVVGSVGSPERLSYTVMGDGVNVASRMEGLNKNYGTAICISESVHELVADRVLARPIRRLSVKGRSGTFLVYELLGITGDSDPELRVDGRDVERCRMTAVAMALLDAGRFVEARDQYQRLLDAYPDDGVALAMRNSAAQEAGRVAVGH